jgi:hypothetical protein
MRKYGKIFIALFIVIRENQKTSYQNVSLWKQQNFIRLTLAT